MTTTVPLSRLQQVVTAISLLPDALASERGDVHQEILDELCIDFKIRPRTKINNNKISDVERRKNADLLYRNNAKLGFLLRNFIHRNYWGRTLTEGVLQLMRMEIALHMGRLVGRGIIKDKPVNVHLDIINNQSHLWFDWAATQTDVTITIHPGATYPR